MRRRLRKRFKKVGELPWPKFKKTPIYDILQLKRMTKKRYGSQWGGVTVSAPIRDILMASEQMKHYGVPF